MYDIKDYSYELPPDLIAQVPEPRRDHSRLLVVDRLKRSFSAYRFFDLPQLLRPGDLLVVNNTKVVPARLFGQKESGGRVEILVIEHPEAPGENPTTRTCLVKSSKRPKRGSRLFLESGLTGEVEEVLEGGLVRIRFFGGRSLDSIMEAQGRMPVPPYIERKEDGPYGELDGERYQTVFSRVRGAIAAPTAGLHFTEALIRNLAQAGVSITQLTLHVGYATFRPVRCRDIRDHHLGEESYQLESRTVKAIEEARAGGGRVVAVGTTVVRALETAADPGGELRPGKGRTDLLIVPGFRFKVVDGLVTNFHLPRSSLLFLVSAFAGRDLIRGAYNLAVQERFRFYSYGDAMLII